MKYLVTLVVLASGCLASCRLVNAEDETVNRSNISPRNTGISRSIAYSDLFLDSLKMEAFIRENSLEISIADRMRSFYNTRNYQYAWFNSGGLTEQAIGFYNLYDHYVRLTNDSVLKDISFKKRMDALMEDNEFKVSETNKRLAITELDMTTHFMQYCEASYGDRRGRNKELEYFVPIIRQPVMEMADSLLESRSEGNRYFETVHPHYRALKEQLEKYYGIAKEGGWQLPPKRSNSPVRNDTALVSAVQKHLKVTGDYPGGDSSGRMDETLRQAIRQYQARFGLKRTGEINAAVLKEMSVPVENRIAQLLVNLNRMRWMPEQPRGTLLMINIPEYMLHAWENGTKSFEIPVVVGKAGNNTTMFTGTMNQVVFCPYWHVPPDIVREEIIPAMEEDPGYLEKNGMEMEVKEDGSTVIRQLPGEQNALGKVKFLFPNRFNIYLHDSPAKSLFDKSKRAFSHGCIRVKDPVTLARWLLRDQADWSEEKITKILNGGEEKTIRLKKPAEVFITYYTAWVDENGLLHFREDIYERDAQTGRRFFTKT